MALPFHLGSSVTCNISGSAAWIFNETHRNDTFQHGVQAFPLPVRVIGTLVAEGLQVRTETLINILPYPAGLTDVEFSARSHSCISNSLQRPSVYVTGFSTILNPAPVARNRGCVIWSILYEQTAAYATFQTGPVLYSLMFDHVCSWVCPGNFAVLRNHLHSYNQRQKLMDLSSPCCFL